MGQVIMLGTGDPFNEERVQACLALPLDGGETLLIDTSSGTDILRQLRAAGLPPESIRHIFITHRHFDHAGGLAPLLVTLVPLREVRVTVHAPPETLRALHELLALSIPGVEDWLGARLSWHGLAVGRPVAVGSALVTPFAVDHGLECVGLRIAQGGATAVFSADTRPHRDVVAAAQGADLLIHEAYGLQNTAAAAHMFGHSTAADAGATARAAGVPRLLLTHLRASYHVDAEALRAEASEAHGRPVEVAGDLQIVAF